jgi:kexin
MFLLRIADPLYSQQWHLHDEAWAVDINLTTRNGTGVTIAIVDDGVQHRHPDLTRRFDSAHSWDFNDKDSDPSPTRSEQGHGTSAAGVAVAEKENGVCGQGAAPGARLVGIRLIAAGVSDYVQAQGLSHNAIANVDIYSCSWGPADDGMTLEAPEGMTSEALAWHTQGKRGRLGKGTIYVWAAGNGREQGDSCAFDGYASSMFVNAIGAIDHEGKQSWYSEGCAALMAVAPSSGSGRGITTIDLLGRQGYSPDDCTSTFGGTSSAAPLASGIIALMLQERPDLTWCDVKHVLAKGATPVDLTNHDWTIRPQYRHSYSYGFGLLKVPKLLETARGHHLVPEMKSIRTEQVAFGQRGTLPFNYSIPVRASNITFVEHVELNIQIQHPRRGAVQIVLISPDGTESIMAHRRPLDFGTTYDVYGWTFTSVRFWGSAHADGAWTVLVDDYIPDRPHDNWHGIVTAVKLNVHGY